MEPLRGSPRRVTTATVTAGLVPGKQPKQTPHEAGRLLRKTWTQTPKQQQRYKFSFPGFGISFWFSVTFAVARVVLETSAVIQTPRRRIDTSDMCVLF